MCKGSRGVTAVLEALIIGDQEATPDSDRFLTVEAASILKGIRKNDLNPFLQHLAKEGLWDLTTPYKRLALEKRELILFGFWSRPGPGSFLKSPRSNPAEVASWLRWDGLYRHILDQADRSSDGLWARRIRESAQVIRCVRCGGSGLQRFASLLKVGDKSFAEWASLSDTGHMLDLLDKVELHTPRQRHTSERILHCLAPLAHAGASAISVIERTVESFTTMAPVESGKLGGT
jgi:excinuclease UvrABC ATPase subunit